MALGEEIGFWTLGEGHPPPSPPRRPCVVPFRFQIKENVGRLSKFWKTLRRCGIVQKESCDFLTSGKCLLCTSCTPRLSKAVHRDFLISRHGCFPSSVGCILRRGQGFNKILKFDAQAVFFRKYSTLWDYCMDILPDIAESLFWQNFNETFSMLSEKDCKWKE